MVILENGQSLLCESAARGADCFIRVMHLQSYHPTRVIYVVELVKLVIKVSGCLLQHKKLGTDWKLGHQEETLTELGDISQSDISHSRRTGLLYLQDPVNKEVLVIS